jgi:4-coumarate--CoA ligase
MMVQRLQSAKCVRFSPAGYLYIVDRVKELIKYKGFQVPPAELEGLPLFFLARRVPFRISQPFSTYTGILLSHPLVLDCAVVPKPDLEAGELPTAFVVIRKDSSQGTADESALRQQLHDYVNARVSHAKQLRGGIVFIDAIPRATTGKILRRVLRDQLSATKAAS